ncbi:electron transfer flavoprotein alpha subunit [Desulfitispora alkaliphila]|uniref:FAD-binding protein n=1 Tax=Desulfitispora alkaliphila TaxID=622674 RepID=UPI003D1B289C
MVVKIYKEKCIGCGLCLEACPFDVLTLKDGIVDADGERCTDCGACEEVCPTEALEVDKPPKEMSQKEAEKVEIQKEKAHEIHKELERYKGIWVFVEHNRGEVAPVSWELMGEARRLADKLRTEVAAIVLGEDVQGIAQQAFHYGADKVYFIEDSVLKDYRNQAYTHGVVSLVNKYNPEIFLIGATSLGRDLAGSVATVVETGLTADCTVLDVEDESRYLLQSRPAFGGNIMATILCRHHRPQMATVRPRVFEMPKPDESRSGDIIQENLDLKEEDILTRVVEVVKERGSGVYLDKAEIIVAGGRGVGKKENMELLQDLANTLGGTLGASRAAVDAGWISVEHQVGQTGVTVRPKVYFALGISGAIQHLVGMQSSDIIVAVNKDPDAEIFKVATYGIVGDLSEVVPAITEEFKKRI